MLLAKYNITSCFVVSGIFFCMKPEKNRLIIRSLWLSLTCHVLWIRENPWNFHVINSYIRLNLNFLTTKYSGDESSVSLLFSFKLEEFLRMWRLSWYLQRAKDPRWLYNDGITPVENGVYWRHLFVRIAYLKGERQPLLGLDEAGRFWILETILLSTISTLQNANWSKNKNFCSDRSGLLQRAPQLYGLENEFGNWTVEKTQIWTGRLMLAAPEMRLE